MKFTVTIPTYNRYDNFLSSTIDELLKYDSIERIVLVDDDSFDYDKLVHASKNWDRVEIYRNEKNLGCYLNKLNTYTHLKEDEWCILLDSDNMLRPEYIDAILEEDKKTGLDKNTAYLPTAALPDWNYDFMSGVLVTPENFNEIFIPCDPQWNTCNFLLHSSLARNLLNTKEELFDDVLPYNRDACFINFLIAKSKGNIKFLPGMAYEHRLHNHGHNYHHEDDAGQEFFDNWDWSL